MNLRIDINRIWDYEALAAFGFRLIYLLFWMWRGWIRLRLKCNGTSAETRFRLSAKRKSPFKSVGASVQSTIGSRGVRISGSNARYNMFRGSVKGTDYLLHSRVSPSLSLPCVTVCHYISTGAYLGSFSLLRAEGENEFWYRN